MAKKNQGNIVGTDLIAPTFIKQFENGSETLQVSARVPLSTKLAFDKAQETLRQHGLDMQLNDVIRHALQTASEYVQQKYGLQTTADASKPASMP